MDLDEIREHEVNDALDARREPGSVTIANTRRCPECSREFDLHNEEDAEEWFYGHDCEEAAEEAPTKLSFLTAKGNELLTRAKRGVREGKVEAALMRDIDSVLLDGCEMFNGAIEAELEQRGA